MTYESGAHRLDTATHTLTRANEPVLLTPKAYDLLLLLLASGGRALPKAELMAALWQDSFVEEANLTFQISVLRKALGEEGKSIETIPKHGYRFVAPVRIAPEDNSCLAARADSWKGPHAPAPPGARIRHARLRRLDTVPGAPGGVVTPAGRACSADLLSRGSRQQPSLSPDGSQVAFSWNGPNANNYDIYVKLVGPVSQCV